MSPSPPTTRAEGVSGVSRPPSTTGVIIIDANNAQYFKRG
jgi:hypothetical protein